MLLGSVVLMACVGAAQSLFVLLIRPDFRPRAESRVAGRAGAAVHATRIFHRGFYLRSDRPRLGIHNVWTMVAFAILVVFLIKGSVRLSGQLPGQLCRRLRRHRPAQHGVRQSAQAGRAVLRSHFHRPADVVHHERHRKDPGGASRTFWPTCCGRASLSWVCCSSCCTRTGSWPWSA